MNVTFTKGGWDDFQYWMANDKAVLKKLVRLIDNCSRSPFDGIGKPEPLKGSITGWWSRRITDAHRLVYRVSGEGHGQLLEILQCRGHY